MKKRVGGEGHFHWERERRGKEEKGREGKEEEGPCGEGDTFHRGRGKGGEEREREGKVGWRSFP